MNKYQFTKELCKILDLDPKKTLNIQITVTPSQTTAFIEYDMADLVEPVIGLLQKVAWFPVEESSD